MNKNNQLFLGSLLALSLTSLSAHAANINTVFSWETADYDTPAKEGANKRGNSSRLTQSFHFFMFEPIFSPVNALNQPI
ncbi:hypothetical protein [Edwardsiella tarda]|uniref:hypothetical protein n=1 Tax=Edwardsiella tarda TaxID=636 RepID=UPI00351C3F0D